MQSRFSHWVVAGAAALVVHGALGYALFYSPRPTQGARAEGVGGLEISISMVAAAVGSEAQEEVVAEEPVTEPEPIEEPSVEEQPEPEPEPVQEPEPEPEPVQEPEPDALPLPEPEVKPEPVKPKQKVPEITPPKKPEVQKKTQPKPKPVVQKQPQPPKQVVEKKKIEGNKSQGATQSVLNANRSDTTNQQGGGQYVGEVTPDYVTTLRRRLEQHKTYPRRAKRRRQEGVVVIEFTVTREGQVTEFKVRQGSGHDLLDEETIAMLKRAQPLPAFPKDMEGEFLKIALPIHFSIR
ncbi:TonB family protein [Terasakiella pusilla]|uniref:energy transducer TonB n=1 Tax=Terasakiella pusilla TaxID=64973 RepID=UPI003AA91B57